MQTLPESAFPLVFAEFRVTFTQFLGFQLLFWFQQVESGSIHDPKSVFFNELGLPCGVPASRDFPADVSGLQIQSEQCVQQRAFPCPALSGEAAQCTFHGIPQGFEAFACLPAHRIDRNPGSFIFIRQHRCQTPVQIRLVCCNEDIHILGRCPADHPVCQQQIRFRYRCHDDDKSCYVCHRRPQAYSSAWKNLFDPSMFLAFPR